MNLLVLNGVNLNLLGSREPGIYGNQKYKELEAYIKDYCKKNKIKVKIIQTNDEAKFIDYIHKSNKYGCLIINPGAWTHYSYAIRDAVLAVKATCCEVHLTDPQKREEFRHVSVLDEICPVVSGKGFDSYIEAIKILEDDL